MNHKKITIIGGGLTGLTLSYLLKKKDFSSTILEARDRSGGRIYTKYRPETTPVEMGATWYANNHIQIQRLLQELNIGTFKQDQGGRAIYEPISTSPPQLVPLPPNEDPSFRIRGGTSTIINQMVDALDPKTLLLDHAVKSIAKNKDGFKIETNKEVFHSDILVSTLPPFLLNKSIAFNPRLPSDFTDVAEHTHTWMGESIKIALTYKEPFWRNKDSSGTIFSNVGPISEMYDHSNYENNQFALKGFLNSAYSATTKKQRIDTILKQLQKYYGEQSKDYLFYEEVVWSNEPLTFASYNSDLLPHQNNGNSIFRKDYLGGYFLIAGSETSPSYPGYMEGAVHSAMVTCESIERLLKA
jgi:monoamine oxidase